MPTITMPQLGESVTEGTISKWLVSPGDHVNKYDPIAEVMTDKVNAEVPSSYSGVIKEILVSEDETVGVGTPICMIEVEGEETSSNTTVKQETSVQINESVSESSQESKGRYSPAVLRLAEENNIDLSQVSGSGKGGRITRKDIIGILETGQIPAPKPEIAVNEKQEVNLTQPVVNKEVQSKVAPVLQPTLDTGDVEIPVSGVRKAIAANMVKSKHEAPHAWMMVEVDVTNLVNYRNQVKDDFKSREGYSLTFLPFFIKAVVEALKEYPMINSTWAHDKIIQKKDINISIAVATDDALYVPVIKNADERNIKGIAREVNDLAAKVRTQKLKSEDMQGGTFTVNNTGSFGSILSTPIINSPQAAILSIESIVKRPVVMENDMIAIRSMVNLCLSLDHRVLDGLVCGRFLARIKERLEHMNASNTSIY